MDARERAEYWRQNMRLIGVLLAIWLGVSLGAGVLAVRWLNAVALGAVPLGFWIAQQGAIFVFVGIIFFYAWRMDRVDRAHHAAPEDETP